MVPQPVGEYSQAGEVLGTIGTGQIGLAEGLATDSDGNLWVSDSSNNRVRRSFPAGELIRQFGSNGTASGQFKKPGAIAVDPTGQVWVVDRENSELRSSATPATT